jgi:hypothetical protein
MDYATFTRLPEMLMFETFEISLVRDSAREKY